MQRGISRSVCLGYDAKELNQFMPIVSSNVDFQKLISLRLIYVYALRKDGFPYVGFKFETSWDPEHGLGVLAHENRVVEIGGEDTAMLLWIAERVMRKNPKKQPSSYSSQTILSFG